ncbi:MAG TPA: lytic transglycosylase F [Vicinamibacterales bacterium]|nr:lytic transglycosylase F [Vicinamibacterales bacterium]
MSVQAGQAVTIAVTMALLAVPARAQAPTAKGRTGLTLDPLTTKWTGDFDGMIERRLIRILTVYSKTLYFIDNGTPRGTAYDQGKLLEDAINKSAATGLLKINVQFVPMSRDELIPALLDGRGDIIMADMTVTPERIRQITFTEPWIAGVDEIVVTSPDGPAIDTLDDLSGKEVFVRQSSSYFQSLVRLNDRLTQEGKPPVSIVPAPEELEDEDLLEMANAGLVKVLVVDNHKAWFWQRVWPNLKLHPSVALRTNGEIAWAIRPDSPDLLRALNGFLTENGRNSLNARMIFRRYLLNTQYVKGSQRAGDRFRAVVAMFRKYGQQYNMDWMLMAAQGYQESRLDQRARSHVGAIGVMQVMPATGRELGVGDITKIDANIHAGVKFVRQMIDRYYANEPMTDLDKGLFAFASYNAGPGRIRQLRREAAARGLDPNVWFNNVERETSERIGRETVTYVSNIYKYYVAYLLVQGEYLKRRGLKAR